MKPDIQPDNGYKKTGYPASRMSGTTLIKILFLHIFSLDSLGVNYTDGVTVRIADKYTVSFFLSVGTKLLVVPLNQHELFQLVIRYTYIPHKKTFVS